MPSPDSPEKLQTVINALRDNDDIVVVGGDRDLSLEEGVQPEESGIDNWLTIYSHPSEPLYTAGELNDFMQGFVSGNQLEPTEVTPFRANADFLELGMLDFDEVIGKVTLRAAVQLQPGIELVKSGRLPRAWESTETTDLTQRTRLRILPNSVWATGAAKGRLISSIYNDVLRSRTHSDLRTTFTSVHVPDILEGIAQVEPEAVTK